MTARATGKAGAKVDGLPPGLADELEARIEEAARASERVCDEAHREADELRVRGLKRVADERLLTATRLYGQSLGLRWAIRILRKELSR